MQTNESESYILKYRTFKHVFFVLGILAMALALLLFTNGSNVSAAPDPPPTYVWEDIDANTTWVSGSVHIVNSTNPIHIKNGTILTIQPNAVVRFDNGTGLIVEDGKLIADASNSPALIMFTSNYSRATTVLWDGITIGEDGSATFKNVAISYADTAIAVDNGTIDISNVNISTVYTGVDIVKDTTSSGITISKLMVNNYRDEGLLLTADNLTFNFELKDSVFTGGALGTGIQAISSHLTTGATVIILNNVTVTGGETGVDLLAQTRMNAFIVNCKFNSQLDTAVAANSVSGNSTFDMQFNVVTNTAEYGIHVIGGTVNILNNTVMEGTGYGIYVEDAHGSVNGNIVSGFSNSGILVAGCSELEVVDNTITGSANDSDWALYIDHGHAITVIGNVLEMNYRGLYAVDIVDSNISDNEIMGCTYQGVNLIGLVSCLVEDNIISDNGANGVYIDGGHGLVFGNNTVSNNEGIGVDIDAGINDQIWLYNGMYEYNDEYGIFIEAGPYTPLTAWYGVKWIIDDDSRVTFNDVWFDGDITVIAMGRSIWTASIASSSVARAWMGPPPFSSRRMVSFPCSI